MIKSYNPIKNSRQTWCKTEKRIFLEIWSSVKLIINLWVWDSEGIVDRKGFKKVLYNGGLNNEK